MVNSARDFIGYGGNPPRVEWPGGARIALNVVINYEEGSEMGAVEGDRQREMQAEWTYPAKPDERELVNESMFEYGSRVGVWRIMRILDKYDATCTIFASALALERNPEVARAFVGHGYDMVGHGYRWVPHYGMSAEQEREEIRKTRESIQRTTEQRILGWFTRPLQTLHTRRILAEEGFLYDSGAFNDDLPYFEKVGDKPFLVVPYSLDQNDIRFWKNQLFTANDFFEYQRDAFDTLYEEGATRPKMMSVGLHNRVIGRPGRAQGLDRFLAHVRKFPGVWIANRNAIAKFWLENFASHPAGFTPDPKKT
jgi:peptidoglycan/xylan/chitin deacetylase (PgdA/CDA1 family)